MILLKTVYLHVAIGIWIRGLFLEDKTFSVDCICITAIRNWQWTHYIPLSLFEDTPYGSNYILF